MDIGQMGLIIAGTTGISTASSYLLNKVVSKTKHETSQDDKIIAIETARNECILERRKINDKIEKRLCNLEKRDTDREIMLAQIKEKMESLIQGHEHTQSMITQLTEHQQTTFSKLIDTINNMGSK